MPFVAAWMDLEIITLSEVRKRKIPYDITYMCNLKCNTNELIYETETDSDTENKLMVTKREGEGGRGKLGIWDQQIQTTTYKIDKQQGPTVQHSELYTIPCNKP